MLLPWCFNAELGHIIAGCYSGQAILKGESEG